MIIETEDAVEASIFQHATARNLLLLETELDGTPEWACLETWSSGPDARARTRQRRSMISRRHRG